MKSLKTLIFLFMLVTLGSCGVGEAEDIASEFHKNLDAGNYKYIVEHLIYKETLVDTGEDAWYDMFTKIDGLWGKASSREQDFGFESSVNNGVTSVKLDYTVNYSGKTVYERLFLADNGEGFKITGFFLNENKAELERQAGDLN